MIKPPPNKLSPQAERARLQPALDWMQANFRLAPRLDDVADVVGLSPWHFHRRFLACFGRTFKQVLNELVLAESKKLLLAGTPLCEIAEKVGLKSQSHFCARFKMLAGQTPRQWVLGKVV